MAAKFSKNLKFLFKSSNSTIGNKYCQLISLMWQAHFVHFRKFLPNIQFWITTCCLSVLLWSKNGIPLFLKKRLFQLITQTHYPLFFFKHFSSSIILWHIAEWLLRVLLILSHTILKHMNSGSRLARWIIFTASSRTFLSETGHCFPAREW